jgi:glycosyltransferase involved in cell wall biosynthesis
MKAARATILIPSYNASATIADTLRAVQATPGLNNIEAVIVLDDASSDDTIEKAETSWQADVPLLVWRNSTNVGQHRTVNSGFARLPSHVEWAFILHADDIVKPNWIFLYLDVIESCAADVASICSSYDSWYPETGKIDSGDEYPDRSALYIPGTRDAVVDTLRRGCWWHISGCAIRTAAFRKIGDFDPEMDHTADWVWLLRCLAMGFSVAYIPRTTMRYRQHASSVSSRSFRTGRDIRERLETLLVYRNHGYLSDVEYRREMLQLIHQLGRRTLVRGWRRDIIGVRHHASLFGVLSAKYLLKRL